MSKTVKDVTRAFALGIPASCRNANTDGQSYWLHGNRIARKLEGNNRIEFNWCNWYTRTTANHINACLQALARLHSTHIGNVSYAHARDNNERTFVVDATAGVQK